MWRRCSLVKALLVLALLLIGIRLFLLIMANLLETRQESVSGTRHKKELDAVYKSMMLALESSQVMDSSGHYTIVSNVIKSKVSNQAHYEAGYDRGVTLVSQCSSNHLHQLLDLVNVWQGPISVAVFATDEQLKATVDIILKLVECESEILQRVSLHLIFNLLQPNFKIDLKSHAFAETEFCDDIKQVRKGPSTATGNYAWKDVAYPTNLLRNVALENAIGYYVFVIDIDMLPSHGLYFGLKSFFSNFSLIRNDYHWQVAFVVPAFELQENVEIPTSKWALTRSWQKKGIRPFYEELCWKCQRHTNYSVWRDLPSDSLGVGFAAQWKDPWEPFYVVPRSAPRYDERFRQYGFNRISQSCELHVAGFQFLVLNNAFLVHRGFKTDKDFHKSKETEQNMNRLLYRKFKEELKEKYPDSNRRCY